MATAKIIELTESNTCKICDNALARYSCPRCNIIYCSLTCYQSEKHLDCSEAFYRDCIVSELKDELTEGDNQAKMMEILQRVHETNKIPSFDGLDEQGYAETQSDEEEDVLDSDDEEFVDINERLAGIDLDNAEQVWDKLTEDERQEFVAFLRSEDVTKLIPTWEPWWMYFNKNKVEEVGDTSSTEDFKSKCPKLFHPIADFNSITKKPPADCVKYNLINVLATYAFTTRYFNGEHYDFAKEVISCICSLSLNLKSAQNFNDLETAIKSIEQECYSSDWIVTDAENMQIMREDLERILQGPNSYEPKFYILCAPTVVF